MVVVPARGEVYASPDEINNCTFPRALIFWNSNAYDWPTYKVQRYVAFPGGTYQRMIPQPGYLTGKNPIMNPRAAPYQGANCSNGTGGTQWVVFRLYARKFFGSGIGNHIFFGLGAVLSSTFYDGQGIAMRPGVRGVIAERATLSSLGNVQTSPVPGIVLHDLTQYFIAIHSTPTNVAFNITDETDGTAGVAFGFSPTSTDPRFAPLNGRGFFTAVLCNGNLPPGTPDPMNCENWTRNEFRMDMWEIRAGWF